MLSCRQVTLLTSVVPATPTSRAHQSKWSATASCLLHVSINTQVTRCVTYMYFFFLDLQRSKGNSQERQRVKNRKILKVDCSTFDFRPKTTSLSDRDSAIERDRVFRPPRIRAQRIPNHK